MNGDRTRPAPVRRPSPASGNRVGNRGLTLGRFFGIEVGLDPSWFIIFLLVTWSLAGHYFMVNVAWTGGERLALALITSLFFFASVLAHEFGHSLVANALGIPVKRITLFIFGGVAHLDREPKRARDEFWIAIAGPLVSLALAALFYLLWWLGGAWQLPMVAALGLWLGWINLALAVFNLIPGFPLDGGRVLRAAIWGASSNVVRATRVTGAIGQIVALLFIALGLWQLFSGAWLSGLWIAFIGWFLYSAAAQSVRQITLESLLAGRTVAEARLTDCPRAVPEQSLEQFVQDTLLPSARRCFPVLTPGSDALLGLVTLHEVKAVPRERWPFTRVSEMMIPADALLTTQPDEPLSEALARMTENEVNQLPVLEHGRFHGMLTRARLLLLLQTLSDMPALQNVPMRSGGDRL